MSTSSNITKSTEIILNSTHFSRDEKIEGKLFRINNNKGKLSIFILLILILSGLIVGGLYFVINSEITEPGDACDKDDKDDKDDDTMTIIEKIWKYSCVFIAFVGILFVVYKNNKISMISLMKQNQNIEYPKMNYDSVLSTYIVENSSNWKSLLCILGVFVIFVVYIRSIQIFIYNLLYNGYRLFDSIPKYAKDVSSEKCKELSNNMGASQEILYKMTAFYILYISVLLPVYSIYFYFIFPPSTASTGSEFVMILSIISLMVSVGYFLYNNRGSSVDDSLNSTCKQDNNVNRDDTSSGDYLTYLKNIIKINDDLKYIWIVYCLFAAHIYFLILSFFIKYNKPLTKKAFVVLSVITIMYICSLGAYKFFYPDKTSIYIILVIDIVSFLLLMVYMWKSASNSKSTKTIPIPAIVKNDSTNSKDKVGNLKISKFIKELFMFPFHLFSVMTVLLTMKNYKNIEKQKKILDIYKTDSNRFFEEVKDYIADDMIGSEYNNDDDKFYEIVYDTVDNKNVTKLKYTDECIKRRKNIKEKDDTNKNKKKRKKEEAIKKYNNDTIKFNICIFVLVLVFSIFNISLLYFSSNAYKDMYIYTKTTEGIELDFYNMSIQEVCDNKLPYSRYENIKKFSSNDINEIVSNSGETLQFVDERLDNKREENWILDTNQYKYGDSNASKAYFDRPTYIKEEWVQNRDDTFGGFSRRRDYIYKGMFGSLRMEDTQEVGISCKNPGDNEPPKYIMVDSKNMEVGDTSEKVCGVGSNKSSLLNPNPPTQPLNFCNISGMYDCNNNTKPVFNNDYIYVYNSSGILSDAYGFYYSDKDPQNLIYYKNNVKIKKSLLNENENGDDTVPGTIIIKKSDMHSNFTCDMKFYSNDNSINGSSICGKYIQSMNPTSSPVPTPPPPTGSWVPESTRHTPTNSPTPPPEESNVGWIWIVLIVFLGVVILLLGAGRLVNEYRSRQPVPMEETADSDDSGSAETVPSPRGIDIDTDNIYHTGHDIGIDAGGLTGTI